MKKRVGILTSGGDCPGLNATIRGVAKALYARMGENVQIVGILNGYHGLITGEYKEMTQDDFRGILTLGGTILGTKRTPFKMMRVVEDDNIDKVAAMKRTYKEAGLDCLLCLGGNGTHKTANLLSQEGLNIIGLPKTIDNDLCLTDHTPGYGSAAKYIATILKEVIRDSSVYDIRSVTVSEIMGRHAGWLAGAACLAGGEDCEGPDLILLPEVPFVPEKFLAKVDELQRTKSNVIIAASEGVKTADGTYLCDLVSGAGQLDAFGHKAILSGTSRYLSELIHEKLNCKSRAIEFSTLQRCASHLASRTDVSEAYAAGAAAAAAAFAGETGRMIALKRISAYPYQCVAESVDVQQVANLEKKVPLDWITPDGMQVTAAFEEYARPLILDEVTPVYVNGTPRHICL